MLLDVNDCESGGDFTAGKLDERLEDCEDGNEMNLSQSHSDSRNG